MESSADLAPGPAISEAFLPLSGATAAIAVEAGGPVKYEHTEKDLLKCHCQFTRRFGAQGTYCLRCRASNTSSPAHHPLLPCRYVYISAVTSNDTRSLAQFVSLRTGIMNST